MIDAALVGRKALLITRDLADLAPLARTPLADYLANARDELVAERLLERIIGRMIDINYHLLTETAHPPPADYYASFTQLAALGVYDIEFGRRIAACAGLRNRIVHEYDEVDPRKVHEALGTAIQDVSTYLLAIDDYGKRTSGG
ncbi:MAG: hypothetical protein DMD86_14710 [Candidatus Rokuibacteriota bacterium]|nr:MAG: hypothetical protein DMD86_14710 [Candidatus Rokubacteria bacterium]